MGGATMRMVLDQGVPRDAATQLRDLGHECMHVGEIGMFKAADDEILAWALVKRAIVVTLDSSADSGFAGTDSCRTGSECTCGI